jgi:hypothetical protein
VSYLRWLATAAMVCALATAVRAASGPGRDHPTGRRQTMSSTLQLHPENPHYFLYQGKPTLLITSGEHYGAVLNRAFDYRKYLATLQRDGLNLTRTFVGGYMEHPAAFDIAQNTLAPGPGQLICPWARSDTPGYRNEGNRFDLKTWDEAYFARLKDFVATAAAKGVMVEVCLFCTYYGDPQWELSPWHRDNNVNGIGDIARADIYVLGKSPELLAVQEAMVRKVAAELNAFDNFYFEVCNEPYFENVTPEWQAHMADVIAAAEAALPKRHLISQNVANGAEKVTHPHPAISILNFHYATPPDTVGMNFDLGRVIGDNETGFKGTADTHYRIEGWEFMLAGGGLYNNLDYSFTVGHEDGTFQYPDTQPGGGTIALRHQLGVLKRFLEGFDFVKMGPDNAVVKGGLAEGQRARFLSWPGKQYAGYVFGGPRVMLQLDLPKGTYAVQWLNPVTGEVVRGETLSHAGGTAELASPDFGEDIALGLVAK